MIHLIGLTKHLYKAFIGAGIVTTPLALVAVSVHLLGEKITTMSVLIILTLLAGRVVYNALFEKP